jgi:endo-1,4-beta-xylanase
MKQRHIFLFVFLSLFITCFTYGQDLPVTVQAESGTLGSDFRIVDTLAVTSVTITTNTVNSMNPGNDNRVITYQVTFPDSGTYDLYAHVLVGKNMFDDDSYFYANGFGSNDATVDGDWIIANGLADVGYTDTLNVVDGGGSASSGEWKWIDMSKFNGGATPITFRVELGSLTQTFQIGARENGLYIDKFVFGRSGLYFTVSNLNGGEAGSETPPSGEQIGTPLAEGQSKFLGSEWDYGQAPDFASYWNQLTPGNAGKWGSVEYTRNYMNWTVLDSTYAYARKYHIMFKEHTLIWGAQQPSWIGALDSASQRQEIEQWFAALASRYDSIDYIDVVNEPIHNAPNGMVPWGTTTPNVNYADALGGAGATGYDWIITSFRLARQYFPKSKLLINEYGVVNSASTTELYREIINLLKADTLIDGIGVQAHAFSTAGISTTTLKANLDTLATTGLPIYVTELDIDGLTDLSQLQEYKRVFPVFWEHPDVKGVTLWGYRSGVWRQDEGAYLITEDDVERPAMKWLKAYVNDTITLAQSIEITAGANADSVAPGDRLQMSALVAPSNTTTPEVSWIVYPYGIATIDSYGVLTAVKTGKATVKATAWDGSGVTDTLSIFISNRLAESLSVSSTNNQDSIFVGETLQMNALVLPQNATNPSVTWSVTPAALAKVSSNGLLTAIANGKVTVKATANDGSGVADSMDVTILNQLIQSINVSSKDNQDSVFVGDSLQMSATVLPQNATNPSVTWSVTPDNLVSISTSGLLSAIDTGKVTVTATANDGSGVSGTMDITITEKISGITNNSDLEKISVYPNPSVNGDFTINGIGKITQIEVYDLTGSKVTVIENFKRTSLNVHVNAKPGIYILKLTGVEQSVYKKIIIK